MQGSAPFLCSSTGRDLYEIMSKYLARGSEVARVDTAADLALYRIKVQRSVGAAAAASELFLKNLLREVERLNPDAAPEAAFIVNTAVSGMLVARHATLAG